MRERRQYHFLAACVLLLLLAHALLALNFEARWFPVRCTTQPPICYTEDGAPSYLRSDLQATPTVALNATTICAGDSVRLTFDASPTWNNGNYIDAATSHGAINTGQLYSYNNAQGPFSVKLMTQSQSNALYDYLSTSPPLPFGRSFYWEGGSNMWQNFLSSQGLSSYQEYEYGVKYKNPSTSDYFSGLYKANVALFCNAKAVVAFNGVNKVDQDYTGGQVSNVVNGLVAGQYTVTSQLAMQRCMPSIKTFTNSVHQYVVVQADNVQRSFSGNQPILTVENPFSCASLPVSNQFVSNPTPAPGAQVNFGFSLTNNLARNMRVTKIELAQTSISQGFVLIGSITPVPVVINTGNGVQAFTGTVQVPSSLGAKSIKVNITYMPDTPACNGQPNCQMTEAQVIDISVVSGQQPDYVISQMTAPAVYTGEQFSSQVTTKNIGAACAQSSSFTNVTFPYPGGALSRLSVPVLCPPDTSTGTVSFTCPSTAGIYTEYAYADADRTISESNEGNNNASLPVSCFAKPDACVLWFSGHGSNFGSPDSGAVAANCTFNGQPTLCPALVWSQTATGNVQMVPTATPRQANPASTLTIGAGVAQQTNKEVNAVSTEPGVPLQCQPALFNITTPASSCQLYPVGHNGNVSVGASWQYAAVCKNNIGQQVTCPQMGWSTNIAGGAMVPQTTGPIWIARSNITIAPSAPSPQTGRSVTASATTFSCSAAVNVLPPLQPDSCQLYYTGGHNGNVTAGGSWQFSAVCTAQGTNIDCPQMSWATNVQGGTMVPAATPPSQYARSNLTISPSAPSPQNGRSVTATAASFSCSAPVNVLQGGIQIISCGFENNHGPVFFPGESEWARATCDVGGRITPCPNLLWSTVNLTQATLNPARTTTEPHRSLFSLAANAPAPQQGGILVQCENPASCINTCNAQVNVSRIPVRMDCYLLNHGSMFAPGDWSLVQANCTDERIQVTACPSLQWLTRNNPIKGGFFNPNPTIAGVKPTTNFSVSLEAPVPQRGYIDAVSTNPLVPGLMCFGAIDTSVVNIGPDYNLSLIMHDPPIAVIGQTVTISVTTTNIGNQNATNVTTTLLTGEGCVEQNSTLRALKVGETVTQTNFKCTCTKPSRNNITAEVNIYHNQYETTYANNKMSSSYYCRTVAQLTCADFV